MRIALLAGTLLMLPAAIQSQPMRDLGLIGSGSILKAGSECTGGIRYDDGTFESSYGFSSGIGTYAMLFDLPEGSNRIDAICLCWKSFGGSSHDHGMRIWAADGPGGAPGTLLSILPAVTLTEVTSNPKFFRYEIVGGLQVPTSSVYVAPTWAPALFPNRFLCSDESTATPGRPAYAGAFHAVSNPDIRPTAPLGVPDVLPGYRALGLRVEASVGSGCVASPTALCLNQGRFKVEASFQTTGNPSGPAQAVKLTDETGYFWFFSAANVEAVVKVINACGLNQRFWVFAGGLTDVRVVLTVTDTANGTVQTYTNPQGTPFQPIQDTDAFATCN